MAIANIKDLWELAATLMGDNAAAEIVDTNTDMSNPTTPLELTLAQFYEPMRRRILESAHWLFATKYEALQLAPRALADGREPSWVKTVSFPYVYREPSDSLRFLGFARDRSDLELVVNHKIQRLPVKYESITSTSRTTPASTAVYVFTTGMPFGGNLYRGGARIELLDDLNHKIVMVDDHIGPNPGWYYNEFRWSYEGESYNGQSGAQSVTWDYNNSISTAEIILIGSSGPWPSPYFEMSVYPLSLTAEVAVEAPTAADWSNFILTHQHDGYGVYIYDATDPSEWDPQFQTYVAAELALAAAGVHSKSSKQIQLLRDGVTRAREEAIKDLAMDHGTLQHTGAISTTERSRR